MGVARRCARKAARARNGAVSRFRGQPYGARPSVDRAEHPEFYVNGTAEDYPARSRSFCRVETPRRRVLSGARARSVFPSVDGRGAAEPFFRRRCARRSLRICARSRAHCDGVRCDMAMLHLNDIFERIWGHLLRGATAPEQEFWEKAHAAVPGLILLAEAYWGTESRLARSGIFISCTTRVCTMQSVNRDAATCTTV